MELRRVVSKVVQLTPVGPNLYRAADRVVASHALLSSGGADTITDVTHTLRKRSGIRYAVNQISCTSLQRRMFCSGAYHCTSGTCCRLHCGPGQADRLCPVELEDRSRSRPLPLTSLDRVLSKSALMRSS